ncbi:hypothetical protein [Pyrobaculum ferrireducens]|uniref:Glutaredoxin n=1 Tax=Pyrobaculum ferrireducens TaxID=1104324 RepID=G7VB01_9CREN|nr:hypothetical protein [Pyrobaculum ferrireducens]AET32311.1 hypothetical protein P186_0870 [Pyrobaculum ferrireducens]
MIEVVVFAPLRVGVCRACDAARAFGVDLTEEHIPAGDFPAVLAALSYLGGVPVRFTNPMSLRGLYLMLRHRTGRLPLVLVGGRLVHSGPVPSALELAERLRAALGESYGSPS